MQEIKSLHHVELYVANAKHTGYYYCKALGFRLAYYGNSTTGLKDRVSYVLQQGKTYIILTSPTRADGDIQKFLVRHGDGVRDVSFYVHNIKKVYSTIKNRKVKILQEIQDFIDEDGLKFSYFTIEAFDDVVHTFISYKNEKQKEFPIFKNFKPVIKKQRSDSIISHTDHIALCGDIGFIDKVTQFYCNKLDFFITRKENIETSGSGMKTIVLESRNSKIKFPTVEPLDKSKKSALEDFLIYNSGSGVHHIAYHTSNIIEAVDKTTTRNVSYMRNVNKSYYNDLLNNNRISKEQLEKIKTRGILFDSEKNGYLLQIFSKPTQPRPTFFFELIQRCKTDGFGSGNIKALYESLETEQKNILN